MNFLFLRSAISCFLCSAAPCADSQLKISPVAMEIKPSIDNVVGMYQLQAKIINAKPIENIGVKGGIDDAHILSSKCQP